MHHGMMIDGRLRIANPFRTEELIEATHGIDRPSAIRATPSSAREIVKEWRRQTE